MRVSNFLPRQIIRSSSIASTFPFNMWLFVAAIGLFMTTLDVPITAQTPATPLKSQQQTDKNGFTYTTVQGDPLGVRVYTLKNGLTVYISVNTAEPRVQTLIGTRAGSKNDPADATGLAHYLEHMLFKGTDSYGTKDYESEKKYLDKIENLYEQYRATKDSVKRAKMYHEIDSLSGEAAKFAIPGEYDKMVGSFGAKGTNAHTSVEETVYENDIPSNRLRPFLQLEAERFRNPVLRLFHTELEAVYEEKNRTLDNDGRQSYEVMMSELYKRHPYGTQSTIGTIDHLKNPSMKKIREYYQKHYIPAAMAIVLAGDVDPDNAIALVDEFFGGFESKPLPEFSFQPEVPITSPIIKTVVGPSAENVRLAFRFPAVAHPDYKLLVMCDMLLSNGVTGLIDVNIRQQQRALGASSSVSTNKDYCHHIFSGQPRQGQSLEEVAALLLAQIEELKKGAFTEAQMKSIILNIRLEMLRGFESNRSRANTIMEQFILGRDWADYTNSMNVLSTVRKDDVVQFAKKMYGNNYVAVYKRLGVQPPITKVPKPPITPVTINRDAQSEFYTMITTQKAEPINPRFTDFTHDILRTMVQGTEVKSVVNKENSLFSLSFIWDINTRHNAKLPIAMQMLNYLGTTTESATVIKNMFYELGCTMSAGTNAEQTMMTLSGTTENLTSAMLLMGKVIASAQPDTSALNELVRGIIKQRVDAKRNKSVILNQALLNYVMYGKRNPFTTIATEKELQSTTSQELIKAVQELFGYEHRIHFYGNTSESDLTKSLQKFYTTVGVTSAKRKSIEYVEPYTFMDNTEGGVFMVDYDMVQAELMMLLKSEPAYNAKIAPLSRVFNEYYGGMSGVVFSTMRESKALAYAVNATYASPRRQLEPYYVQAYIGTQADKLADAVVGMKELLTTMPRSEKVLAGAKESIIRKIESERIRNVAVLQQEENLRRVGLDYDIRMKIFEEVPRITIDDVAQFHGERFSGKVYTYLLVGSKKKIQPSALSSMGTLHELTLEEIFGY